VTISSRAEPKPPVGVIDSLSTGFEIVASHIGLVLFPALLDLFLWLGPQLAIYPLRQKLAEFVMRAQLTEAANAPGVQVIMTLLRILGERINNIFGFLSTAPLGVPVLMTARSTDTNSGGPLLILTDDSSLAFITLVIGFSILGLLLGTIYFVIIARLLDDRNKFSLRTLIGRVLKNWARLTALGVIWVMLGILLALMFIFVYGLCELLLIVLKGILPLALEIGPTAVAWSQLIVGTVGLWLLILLAFSVHGMVLKNRGVLGSIWDSVQLVNWNFLSVVRLFLLAYLITIGLNYVWTLPDPDSWMRLLSIGGHAFISTGLVAATFVFYKDRYRWWTEMREWLMTQNKMLIGK